MNNTQMNEQMNEPTPPSAESRFFAWIRDTGIERSDERWISGVAGGVAARLGWDVVLVRVLFVASVLCFGLGAALYGLLWFVLPDHRSNVILLEDLIEGRWDWSCVGVFLCIIVAMIFPGAGLFIITLAALAAFGLMLWSKNTRTRSESAPHAHSQGAQDPTSQMNVNQTQAEQYSGPVASAQYAPSPHHGDLNYRASQSSAPQYTASQDIPGDHGSDVPQAGVAGAANARNYTGIPYQYRPHVRHVRRKPAGPIVVSAIVGLLFLSAAVMLIFSAFASVSALEMTKTATLWSSVSTIALGVILVVLGGSGRRSGGLTPFAILSLLLTFTLASASLGFAYARASSSEGTRNFVHVTVSANTTLGSSPSDMQRYARGILLDGSAPSSRSFDSTHARQTPFSFTTRGSATIDLSQYERNNGKHTVVRTDGTKIVSACPTGTIKFSVIQTKATIIMPKGCTYELNESVSTSTAQATLGGTFWYLTNSDRLMSFDHWFTMRDSDAPSTSLPKDLTKESLHIEVPSMIGSELAVVYAK
ncbi:MAG: PspC domain-containing protein [Bifidobacterium aquikefiri]